MSARFSVVTLGCKTNQFESAAMAEQLSRAGYRQVARNSAADLVIINTCTVTAATDAQSRNLIRRARRSNPKARIVVTGCYAQVDPEPLSRIPGVALVLGNQEKTRLLDYLTEVGDTPEVAVAPIRETRTLQPLALREFAGRSRAFVQIQNGCDAFCAYCIIPYARGRSRSVPPEEIVTQVAELVAAGYPEIVLTGIHIGQYGQERQPPVALLDLLRRLGEVAGLSRLRLGSLEPTELADGLVDYIARSPWICPHFHIPLQAGDNAVLTRMNRQYSTAFYRDRLERIRDVLPDAAIGLDVIAGFPGETEQEFASTREFLEALPFSHLHVFPFSRRPGTPAARLSGQLPGDLIKHRAALLRAIGAEKHRTYRTRFIDQTLDVVIEDSGRGLTRHYLPVQVRRHPEGAERTLEVRIDSLTEEGLSGKEVAPERV